MDQSFQNANRAPNLIFADLFVESLAIFAVVLRLVARWLARLPLAPDDWMIVLALVIVSGIIPIVVSAVRVGMGRHIMTLSVSDIETDLKLVYACQLVYYTGLTAIKLSILLFYHRLFATRQFRLTVKVVGVIVLSWWVAATMTSIFQCWPISYSWTRMPPGRCINLNQFIIWNAVTNIVIDAVILVMPIRIIWVLQIPRRNKVAISGIFLLGIFVTASSIVRTTYLNHAFATNDPTWSLVPTEIWSAVEPCIGIVCACMPTYGPIIKTLYSHLTSLYSRMSRSSSVREITDSKAIRIYPNTSNIPRAKIPINYSERNNGDLNRLTSPPKHYDSFQKGNPAHCYASTQMTKVGIGSEHILVEQSFQMEEGSHMDYMKVRRDIESHGIKEDRMHLS